MKWPIQILFIIFSLLLGASPSLSEFLAKDSFEANNSVWTVKLHAMENFNSDFAAEAIEATSNSGIPAIVLPAWIGDDPGDIGPLWLIQDQDESVMGACWTTYGSNSLECVPLYVFPTLYLD